MNIYDGFCIEVISNDKPIYFLETERFIHYSKSDVLDKLVDFRRLPDGNLFSFLNSFFYFKKIEHKSEDIDIAFSVDISKNNLVKSILLEDLLSPFFSKFSGTINHTDLDTNALDYFNINNFKYDGIISTTVTKDNNINYNYFVFDDFVGSSEFINIYNTYNSDPGVIKFQLNHFLFDKALAFSLNDTVLKNDVSDKYILIASCGTYSCIKFDYLSIFECQKGMIDFLSNESNKALNGGNVFLNDEYIGWIDKSGRFYDKILPEGVFNPLNGTLNSGKNKIYDFVFSKNKHYIKMSVYEYELIRLLYSNEIYTSIYENKNDLLFYCAEDDHIFLYSKILEDDFIESSKDEFDYAFIFYHQDVNTILSDDLISLRESLNYIELNSLDSSLVFNSEINKWNILEKDESSDSIYTFFSIIDAVSYIKGLFEYDRYEEFILSKTNTVINSIKAIKNKILMDQTLLDNFKKGDSYFFEIPHYKDFIHVCDLAHEMGITLNDDGTLVISDKEDALLFKNQFILLFGE